MVSPGPAGAQNLVQQGYGMRPHATIHVLGVRDPKRAKSWLQGVLERVAFVADEEGLRDADEIVHVAFSAAGLQALGKEAWLDSMSVPFRDGMDAAHRSRVLGDTGTSAPEAWNWGSLASRARRVPHVLLLSYRRDAPARASDPPDGLDVEYGAALSWDRQGSFVREHFGFADGIGQPRFNGLERKPAPGGSEPLALGELLLGYEDERNRSFDRPVKYGLPPPPHAEVLRDGTYLVARQLEQDVFAFWRTLRELTDSPAERVELAARLIGRDPEGRPLAKRAPGDRTELTPDRYDDFDYRHDTDGSGCPFGAHVRRTNPRDWLPRTERDRAIRAVRRHRILRRGRTYGPPVATPDSRIVYALSCSDREFEALHAEHARTERGLLFVGLCADIARQFEFLQQNWVHGSLLAARGAEPDPLIGSLRLPGPRYFASFGRPICTRYGLAERPPVVVRGGAYFFLPSRTALEALCG